MNGLMERAVISKQRIEMVYISSEGDMSQRMVRVLEVREGTILAFCLARRKVRTFKRDNILSVFPPKRKKGGSPMSNGPNDRGTIKWTSLMLPEHVEAIQKLWKEDDRVEKAILDGQQLEELEFALQRARRDDLPVEIKHHNGFNYSSTKVKVLNLDPGTRKIRCLDIEEKINTSLSFEDIFSVEFL